MEGRQGRKNFPVAVEPQRNTQQAVLCGNSFMSRALQTGPFADAVGEKHKRQQRRGHRDGCRGRRGHTCTSSLIMAATARVTAATAERAEIRVRDRFRVDVPNHAAFLFAPFAVEPCGYMGKPAVRFIVQLGSRVCGREPLVGAFPKVRLSSERCCLSRCSGVMQTCIEVGDCHLV